jgi:hypothetical protein
VAIPTGLQLLLSHCTYLLCKTEYSFYYTFLLVYDHYTGGIHTDNYDYAYIVHWSDHVRIFFILFHISI